MMSEDDPAASTPTPGQISEEAVRARHLQRAADLSLALIYQDRGLTLGEAIQIVIDLRDIATRLFPGSEPTFNLLYRPRLMRAIGERFGIDEDPESDP